MSVLAIDTETTGLDVHAGCKPFAVYCYDGNEYRYWVWDVDPISRQPIVPKKDVREIVAYINSFKELVMHNYSFDLRMLESVGITFKWEGRLDDTGVMGHCLHSAKTQAVRGKLKEMSVIFLEYPKDDEKALQKAVVSARRKAKKLGWTLAEDVQADYWMPRQITLLEKRPDDDPNLSVCDVYGCGDVLRTWSLHKLFKHGIKVEGLQKPYEKEKELYPVVHAMMNRGITVSKKKIMSEVRKRAIRISTAEANMKRILRNESFNPASPTEMRKALFTDLGFDPIRKTKTGVSTDKATIAALHSFAEKSGGRGLQFLDALALYRKNATGRGYLLEYLHDLRNGRLYYSLKQHGTSTTRFSSQRPNAQNVGKGEDAIDEDGNAIVVDSLRTVFCPRPGRLWIAMDYSQLQLRIFAYISKEQSLIDAFNAGWDAHDFVAHKIFRLGKDEKPTKIQRRIGKNVNFGFIFGASAGKIESTAGIPGLWETVTYMFPNAHRYMQNTKWQVRNNKYITTPQGYRLYLPYREGRLAEHAGVNYQVQGCEGSLVKDAMIRNHNYLNSIKSNFDEGEEPFITLQVHDEILYEFPSDLDDSTLKLYVKKLKRNMEKAGADIGMNTPVDVEIIRSSWDKGEHFDV